MIQGYIGEAIFVLDFESPYGTYKALDPEWAYSWLTEFEKLTKVRPLLYLNINETKKPGWDKVVKNGNKLWLASYGNDDGVNHGLNASDLGEWPEDSVVMHQYTTCGLDGKKDSLDLDLFYEGETLWVELAKKK